MASSYEPSVVRRDAVLAWACLDHDLQDALPRLRPRRFVEGPSAQGPTLDILHCQEDPLVVDAHFMNAHHMRMTKPGQGSRFLHESTALEVGVALRRMAQHFDRDGPAKFGIGRGIDHAHRTSSQDSQHVKPTDSSGSVGPEQTHLHGPLGFGIGSGIGELRKPAADRIAPKLDVGLTGMLSFLGVVRRGHGQGGGPQRGLLRL